jgi:hypothetical protein
MLLLRVRRYTAELAAVLFLFLSASIPGFAEDPGAPGAPASGAAALRQLPIPLAAGDVAVTGFSGIKLATPTLPAGVDPLDKTVIDPDGATLRILDLTSLGGPALAQVLNPPVKLAIPARDIGQVFALAFDDGVGAAGTGVPNLYAAATSLYGLQIVGDPAADGSVTRLKAGDPRARFMDAQFGSLPGAGPGAIWKIDGRTGAVSHLADTAFSGVLNSGPGIGDLAFDPQSRNLYASDLDTGLIHRFDLERNAADLGQFDHGLSGRPGANLPSLADNDVQANILSPDFRADDPSTWGFTQPERRVQALAVNDGRLYYSVADGPTIWSVALRPDGAFDTTARLELTVDAEQPFHLTDIVFDDRGRMILAQRATQRSPFDYGQFTVPGPAETLRYTPAGPGNGANLWIPDPEEYPIGLPDGNRQGAGGVTLGKAYNPDGTLGQACTAALMTTGDDLRNSPALAGQLPQGPATLHGIQINDASLTLPQNVPPVATVFAAFDRAQADPAARGHVGDVEAVPCVGAAAPPQVAGAEPIPGFAGPGFAEPAPGFGGPIFPGGTPPVLVPLPEGGFGAGLTLSKFPLVESCTKDGGCAFAITVHNPGPDPFPGPFAINDVFTDGEGGPLAGAKLTSPADPAWTCSPNLPLTCVHPRPLPVGDTTLRLAFAPGDLGGVDDVINCVLPVDPDNPADPGLQPPPVVAPPPLPVVSDKNGLKVAVNPKVPNCSAAKGGCDFEVQLSNTGQAPVKGPLTFVLKATLGADPAQAVIDGTPVSLPAGFACQPRNDGEGARVECTNNAVDIAAGQTQSLTFSLKAKVPAGSPAGSITARVDLTVGNLDGTASNSIAFNDAPPKVQPGQGAGGAPFLGEHLEDQLPPQQCARIPVKPSPDQADGKGDGKDGKGDGLPKDPIEANGLTFSKTPAPGVASCTDEGDCRFTIHVKNDSGAEVKGPIVITDAVQANNVFFGRTTISTPPTPPWKCAKKGQTFECTHPGPIATGASADFTVGFRIDSGQAINEIENCVIASPDAPQKTCATVPVVKPASPPNIGQLTLEKVNTIEQCSDVGGGCAFAIRITNPGPNPFKGDLRINDTVTVDGESVPLTLEPKKVTTQQGGASVGTSCRDVGGRIVCSGPVDLPVGKTIEVPVSIKVGTATGGKQLRNCASIDGSDTQSCATIPLLPDGGPLLRVVKTTSAHTCTPSCDFAIRITNIGTAPTTGPISFEDVITHATAATRIAEAGGSFACSTVTTVPVRLVCITKAGTPPLQPGDSVRAIVRISGLPKDVPSYVNCVEKVTTPGNKKGEDAPVAAAQGANCATVTNDRPKPNLVVTKIPSKPDKPGGIGHCHLNSRCGFHVMITNTGAAPFSGTLHIHDEIQNDPGVVAHLGQGTAPTPIKWSCPDGQRVKSIDCTLVIPPETPLQPNNGVITLDIDVTAGAGVWKKDDILTNCATLIFPAGQSNVVPADAKGCASAKLDPFNVKVTKTGDAACAPGGACHFTIDLFDPGPIPHDAPVTISDKLDAGTARITAITPVSGRPFPCATVPTQIPFSCTSPGNYPLQIGEHVTFQMTVVMPGNAQAQKFVNCATVASPEAGGRPAAPTSGASTSCFAVTAKPPQTSASTPVSCFANMVADANGNCACPAGTEWNGKDCGSGGANGVLPPCPAGTTGTYPDCRVARTDPVPPPSDPTRTTCPPGTRVTRSGQCMPLPGQGDPAKVVSTPVSCFANMVADANGNCACPANTEWNGKDCGSGGANGVLPPCPTGTTGIYPDCKLVVRTDPVPPPINPTHTTPTCPPGTRMTRSGQCVPLQLQEDPAKPETARTCGGGMIGPWPYCRCPDGTLYLRRSRACVVVETQQAACPAGTHRVGRRCLPDKPDNVRQCPNSMVGVYPDCRCPDGTRYSRQTRGCVPVQKQTCQGGMVGVYPNCRCPAGTDFSPQKRSCVPVQKQTCRGGMVGTPPNCRCPAGTDFSWRTRTCVVVQKSTDKGSGGSNGTKGGQACPQGMTGKPPNCCPPGTKATRSGQCLKLGSDQPQKQGSATPGRGRACPGNMIGRQPHCRCPPGMFRVAQRCLYRKPTQKQNDGVVVK